ncbi:hypothetical protein P8C59_002932 [Phyllachora maydis]|uniref:PLC-like phosphodiesterase n=1 Tax=Phyllachora maydis TaxID=1825666 RepID=A0AAD9I0K5_9PEZI|nr:hypothetical protein P8C59_002932 [Phyllachora maydis]
MIRMVICVARCLGCLSQAAHSILFSRRRHDALVYTLVGSVTHVGAHDSAFVGNFPVDNQYTSVTDVLNMGVRFLQAQTHDKDGTVEMCHTSCWEKDAGSLTSYLGPIKTWLDANPNEVLSLLLTNGDAIAVSDFGAVFDSVGLSSYAYKPPSTLALGDWPTLQTLIDAGTRLVVWMDYHADTSSVPYILDEFTYFFETPFDTTDSSFPDCSLDRPSGASASGRMYIVNHYLDTSFLGIDLPNQLAASTTNSVKSISAQADLCATAWGRPPNVILLDWVSKGDAVTAQNGLNGL